VRRLLLIVVVLGLSTIGVPSTQAALRFKSCGKLSIARCATLDVPLDRAGKVPGKLRLHVRRVKARGARHGAVIALSGGPGQAATPFTEATADLFRNALRNRDLIVFDQRGTGRSGLLRCPTLEGLGARLFNVAGAAADCAATLGPRHAFYTTRDSVEDIEAIRRAIGVERVVLYGVSYGTKVALAYAAVHPAQVERLVLDSVVEPDGPDPFSREIFAAIPRVLGLLCTKGCEEITGDPTADLGALVKKLAGGLLHGTVVKPDGRHTRTRLGRIRLLDLLLTGDFDPTLRSGLPAAVRSALAGDAAPILRLADRADRLLREPVGLFNPAVYAATQCEEGPLPWARSASIASRSAQAKALFATIPDSALGPFDRVTGYQQSPVVQLCQSWPTAPAEPATPPRALPDVPALLLAGEDDLRTPLEGTRRIAPRLPHATLLTVPDTGHDVLDSEFAGCSRRALRRFFSNRAIRQCRRRPRLLLPEPIAPTSIAQVPVVGRVGGRAGRTLAAVTLTLRDVNVQLIGSLFTFDIFQPGVGGLRDGRVRFEGNGFRLENVVYVPGVRVSGLVKGERATRGSLRVSGRAAAGGRLKLKRDGSLSGRLGGRRVRLSLPRDAVPGANPFFSRARR
jgi:pimeloyl-ACP methyl ester carboxylesterase